MIGDAGPEIASGLGAFLYAARFTPGFGRAFSFCGSVTTSCRLSRFQSRQLGALDDARCGDR